MSKSHTAGLAFRPFQATGRIIAVHCISWPVTEAEY